MFKVDRRKLKGPAVLMIGNMELKRVIGAGIHHNDVDKGTGEGDRILDSIVYSRLGCRVVVSLDEGPLGVLLHAAISHPTADPSIAIMKALKEAVFGDVEAIMLLPRNDYYEISQSHTFHVLEMPKEWKV